jgi:hypothetical protein
VKYLEDDQNLQEAVLSVHHVLIHTLSSTSAYKVIENHQGVAFIQLAQQVLVQAPVQQKAPAAPTLPNDPATAEPEVKQAPLEA